MRRIRLAIVGIFVAVSLSAPRAAVPTQLFLSEYIEGSSNNKALEIYNGTGAAVGMSAYSIQMFFNGSASAGSTIPLSGTVANGDVFVLAHSSAAAAILAQADQTNGAGWFNGDDAVVLMHNGTVVDVIGQVGTDPGTEWGSGLTSTADNTLRRTAATCGGDPNGSDAFDPALQWDGLATDTFGDLGSYTAACDGPDTAPGVISTTPSSGSTNVPVGASLTVTFSEGVSFGPSSFSLVCTSTGTKTATVSGGPSTYTINPSVDFAGGESCTLTVFAAGVADSDTNDPPNLMNGDFAMTFTAFDACAAVPTPISAIQGIGDISPLAGTTVTTKGVVVGDFEGPSPTLRGFYIQDPAGDGNDLTSDGLFVFNGNDNDVAPGEVAAVTGVVSEFQGQTQVSASSVTACGPGTVAPVDVTLPLGDATMLERFEGMLVRLPQELTVTEHFQLGRFGQVVVSSGGRLRQPTDVFTPGPDADALQAQNLLNRLLIDDALNNQNPDPIVFGRGGAPLSAANTLRAGDTATGTVGVMTYTWAGNAASGNAFRVRPEGALGGHVTFAAANPRAPAPLLEGTLRVASMNVLNFFNTFAGCTAGAGGAPTDCRGAENPAEFARQWPKTVDAILNTNADVVGLLEIENDGYGPDSAMAFLVQRLNGATAAGTWAFIDADAATGGATNVLGTDAIKVALIYKPARVLPVGQTAVLNSPAFETGGDSSPRNRPALTQAFEQFTTGARFVVSVNHLKSKGSACDQPDAGDGQGECNAVRTVAANLLTSWLAGDPTGTGDPDVLILGDLNAYTQEDPVRAIVDASYTNLVPSFGGGYSYVFDGYWGSLDHALASASLRPQVAAAHDWFINADEPSVLDYNTNFKSAGQLVSLYAADRFRMSDHNPLLVDLDLASPVDDSAMVNGAGELLLMSSGGAAAGDPGSQASFVVNVKFKKGGPVPQGHASAIFRRTEADGVHTYQVKATTFETLLRNLAAGQAVVVGPAIITDVSVPESPVTLDGHALMRLAIDDNGNPGVGRDTIGVTVLDGSGGLWFSSNGSGIAAPQAIIGGNLHVR